MTERLEGKPVVEAIQSTTRRTLEKRSSSTPLPGLVSVHLAAATAFSPYLKRQARAAEVVGVRFRDEPLPGGAGQAELLGAIQELDEDRAVHAVLLEHPLPAPLDFLDAVARLRPEKDVDGVGPMNLGRFVGGRPTQIPAVALAALAIAKHYQLKLAGERVAVLGRSASVGLPLALLLLSRAFGANATVTVAHSRTDGLKEALADVQVVFSCVGKPGLLTREVVPRNAAVVDVGLSTVPDPTRDSGIRVVGDSDAESLDGWASALTPVPGGVGPVTVAQLMANTVHCWQLLERVP